MEKNIRNYQKEIIDTIINKIKENKKEIYIEMATGTGKNIVIKKVIEQLVL